MRFLSRTLLLVCFGLLGGITTPVAQAAGIAIGPYLMNPTPTEISVCWVSDDSTTGTVRYSESATPNRLTSKNASEKTRYHRVHLSGLKPYTRYRYLVTCDGRTEEGSFITAAPPAQPFKFVAYGDNRSQPDKHAAVVARIVPFHPDFVLQTGDQVADGANEAQWREFFSVAEPLLRMTAYYPTRGNHEGDTAPFMRYFDEPHDYSFDYGNAHFVALDTNRPDSEHAAQEEWLRRDLAVHQSATWRIVFFHHTVHTCVLIRGRREDAARLRARLEPIFKSENVQLVISGHDHTYQHHFANGIHYVVTGGGGAPLYDLRPDTPFVKTARKAYHDCEISVAGPQLTLNAVEPDGNVIERFEIRAAH